MFIIILEQQRDVRWRLGWLGEKLVEREELDTHAPPYAQILRDSQTHRLRIS